MQIGRSHKWYYDKGEWKETKITPDLWRIELEYDGKEFKGEAVPIPETCSDGVCFQLDVTLNDENLGIIRSGKLGWKMDNIEDQKFIDAIGNEIMLYYE